MRIALHDNRAKIRPCQLKLSTQMHADNKSLDPQTDPNIKDNALFRNPGRHAIRLPIEMPNKDGQIY
jgi:hypothetical protein